MNIAIRKLAMLDKEFTARDEAARIEGYTTSTFENNDFRKKVSELMEKIKVL